MKKAAMGGTTIPKLSSNSERTAWYSEQRRIKRLNQKNGYARKRSITTSVLNRNEPVYCKRHERRKQKIEEMNEKRLKEREKKRKQRTANKNTVPDNDGNLQNSKIFKYRMDKKRAIDKLKGALPETPKKRAATLSAYLQVPSSPTVKIMRKQNIITTPEERKNRELSDQIIENISNTISKSKLRRSNEKRTELHTILASVSGENITSSKVKTNLAKRLGVNRKRVSKGHRVRAHIEKTEESVWKYVQKKTRTDKINDETKRLVYNFWMSEGISRPTGNKADIKRHRIGPKHYLSHPLYILEQTQTDVFMEFNKQYSDVKISQRSFERLKPFFVKPLRQKDKITCCCRYHIEFNHAFKKCMKFRKTSGLSPAQTVTHPIYQTSEDLISNTLCIKSQEQKYHKKACLDRVCKNCGVKDHFFTEKEMDETDSADMVEWEKYEYQQVKGKGTVMCRKLVLVQKVTKVGELFKHFRSLLEKFPRHQFNAIWQNKQAKHITEYLPEGDVVLVHDFSENYRCTAKNEIQSCYFQKTEVSIHVTIIHRHELKRDGALDTENIIQEQFFIISPDLKHDHHFTYHVQQAVLDYLRDIAYPLKTVHEFTDGCASQYKSRHCIGSLNIAAKNMNCNFIRNYYETSHAKGPQDAAGGLLKRQADLAVLRGKTIIQSAKDFYNFVTKDMKAPTCSAKCKQRIFRYVEEIPRLTAKCFKPIQSVRSIHQVFATDTLSVRSRELSCYCHNCINYNYSSCINMDYIGTDKSINVSEEFKSTTTETDILNEEIPIYDLINAGDIIAVLAEDEDYYLLRATGSVLTLTDSTTDNYKTTYEAGTKVIKGHYYCRTGKSVLTYKLETKYNAMVPALSVIYICSEISSDRRIVLSDELHRSILACA